MMEEICQKDLIRMRAIVTIPPYAPFIDEVANHPSVEGLRLNTVMPIKGSLEEKLKELNDKKELWIDLKCRQLRVEDYWVPPYTEVKVSHPVKVKTPVKVYFSDGKESATLVEVDGDRLIFLEGPDRVVGPGESINIVHPTLEIDGFLTDTDRKYIDAANKVGIKNYMLSFVEGQEDIDVLRKYVDTPNIVAKIESYKGLRYVKDSDVRLMAARGDLFVELRMPHHVIGAVERIIHKDKDAIVASRLFSSLAYTLEPTCEDIGDVDNLMRMGYRHFMFGDDICTKRDSIISGLNLFEQMGRRYV